MSERSSHNLADISQNPTQDDIECWWLDANICLCLVKITSNEGPGHM